MENKSIFSICLKYKHFKGGVYSVHGFAAHTETGESLVIYSDVHQNIWARPMSDFVGMVELEDGTSVKRFELMSDTLSETE